MSEGNEIPPDDRSGRPPTRAIVATAAGVVTLGAIAAWIVLAKKPTPIVFPDLDPAPVDPAPIAIEPLPDVPDAPADEPLAPGDEPHADDSEVVARTDDAASSENDPASSEAGAAGDETGATEAEIPRPDPYLESIMLDPLSARDRRRIPRRS